MKIGGHRGCGVTDSWRSIPESPQENSAESIAQAFEQGADFVECDWVWDAQGVGWICHSSRLTDHFKHPPAEYLDDVPSAMVSKMVGVNGHPLISLTDLIERFGSRSINLEIKGVKGVGRPRISFLSQQYPLRWPEGWWLSSFDPLDLLEAQSVWPDVQLGLLSAEKGALSHQYAGKTPYLSGRSALSVLADNPSWWWHPELTDRPPSDLHQIGWSLKPVLPQDDLTQGLDGLITDRLDAWVTTG